MSRFRKDTSITRFLISTPSRFIGESESHEYFLTHAHVNSIIGDYHPTPNENTYRQYLELTVATPEYKNDTIVIPNYSHIAEYYCIALSVLFGKRFDTHGLLLQHGRSYVPSSKLIGDRYNKNLAFNSLNQRCDFSLELNLENFHKITPVLGDLSENKHQIQDAFFTAGKFYLAALREMKINPEISFINLVTSCKVLAEKQVYDKESLLDENIKSALKRIESELNGGQAIANLIKNRMLGISEKFCKLINEHVDDGFFDATESLDDASKLTKDDFKSRLKAAYNIRSKYVHAGTSVKNWLSVNYLNSNEEIISGNPVIENREMAKNISRSPTILGLERIVRYVLIKYLIQNEIITTL